MLVYSRIIQISRWLHRKRPEYISGETNTHINTYTIIHTTIAYDSVYSTSYKRERERERERARTQVNQIKFSLILTSFVSPLKIGFYSHTHTDSTHTHTPNQHIHTHTLFNTHSDSTHMTLKDQRFVCFSLSLSLRLCKAGGNSKKQVNYKRYIHIDILIYLDIQIGVLNPS